MKTLALRYPNFQSSVVKGPRGFGRGSDPSSWGAEGVGLRGLGFGGLEALGSGLRALGGSVMGFQAYTPSKQV